MSGYSKNLLTLEKMLPFLGPVLEGRLCSWEVPAGESDKFAYKVREAFYVARLHRDLLGNCGIDQRSLEKAELIGKMLKIAEMAERFRVVVISPRLVQTQLAKGTTEAMVLTHQGAPANGYEDAGRSTVTVGHQTVETVKQTWLSIQPSNTPLHFPNAYLSYDELTELYKWVTELHLIMFEVDGALTIQRKSADLEGFAWRPRTEVVEEEIDDLAFPFQD